jgi:hypothetical protein
VPIDVPIEWRVKVRLAKLHGIEACVFDAYGTLFDVNSAARSA